MIPGELHRVERPVGVTFVVSGGGGGTLDVERVAIGCAAIIIVGMAADDEIHVFVLQQRHPIISDKGLADIAAAVP